MKKSIRTLLVLTIVLSVLLSTFPCYCLPVYTTGTYFGGSGDDEFIAVRFAPDGTIIAAGNTSSDGPVCGKSPTVLGNSGGTVSSTGFISRFSNDGRTLLNYMRFEWGLCEIDGIAVNSSGIYVTGFASASLAPLITNLGGISTSPPSSGKKPFVVRLSPDGQKLTAGTYLTGADSDRDELALDFLSNGDIAVIHDNGNKDYLSRLSGDLTVERWQIEFNTRAGGCRPQGLAVSPIDDSIYVIGYGMGSTVQEPLKGPFLYKFKGSDSTQDWIKPSGNHAAWNFNPREGDGRLNGLISDSTGFEVAIDPQGNPLVAAYSDGGATVLGKNPDDWTIAEVNIDGDGYWGQSSATSISTIGRMNASNHQWIMAHIINPHGVNPFNRIKGVCSMANDKVLWVGAGGYVPSTNGWYTTGSGIILKTKIDATGTVRQFLTHVPSVNSFMSCTRDRNNMRYAVVGKADKEGAPCPNGIQTSFGGGTNDGFLIVFDDNDLPDLTLTLPDNQSTYKVQANKPADITIKASISTGDEYRTEKVGFYTGNTLIGYDFTKPYSITWENAPAGSHTITAKAFLNDSTVVSSQQSRISINKINGFFAKINWQPSNTELASGFVLFDYGEPFGDRQNGYSYGWSNNATDNMGEDDSDLSLDQSYDTYGGIPYKGKWEISVPNGTYTVRLIAGHADETAKTYDVKAEGTVILHGTATVENRWIEATATVTVADGFLTLTNGSSNNNQLCFIEISSYEVEPTVTPTATPTVTPTPTPTPPQNCQKIEAENMNLVSYTVESNSSASCGECIKSEGVGTASFTFSDTSGSYAIKVVYFDENDGTASYKLSVDDIVIDTWVADQNLGSGSANTKTLASRTVNNITLNTSFQIKLEGKKNSGDNARVDYIEILK